MVALSLPFRRKTAPTKGRGSILDLPFSEYDPTTHLPSEIQIGNHVMRPLVTIEQLKDHLVFLTAIHQLKEHSANFAKLCDQAAFEYQRWAQRTLRAAAFQLTEHGGAAGKKGQLELPTIGVLMCWHAHMLNPRIYGRDVDGAYRPLKGRKFPLREVAEAIRNEALPHETAVVAGEDARSSFETTVWDPMDISAAVQRQAKFVQSMQGIGWLDEGWDHVESLQRGVVRYHAWLDLVHSTQMQIFLVPTLDIDLAWHTHQLLGPVYASDTTRLLGAVLDHNDAAGDGKVDDGLKRTAKLWKERYGWAYQY